MADTTAIEWADATFNPWIGCTKVSPGCDNCYAARQDGFRRWTSEGWGGPRKRTKTWGDPMKWNKAHAAFFAEHGRRQRVFCASLADAFDNQVPDEWRYDLFELIRLTPHLDWLLLTKRIGNVASMIEAPGMQKCGLPDNVWLGATVVNQEEADRDIQKLLAVPARVRFLSMEPLLGPVDVTRWLDRCDHGSRPGPGAVGGVTCSECDGHGHGCPWPIDGRRRYAPEIRDMHFGGRGRVCTTVNRSSWEPGAVERGLVYCDGGHCILVPTVCGNVSRISRLPDAVAAAPADPEQTFAGGGTLGYAQVPPATPLPAAPVAIEVPSYHRPVVDILPPWIPPVTVIIHPPVTPPVPEPSTWALMLVGLVAISVARRRISGVSGGAR